MADCRTGRQPSRIPGNIGILKAKVKIWDHDPFWARPNQIMVWPFSAATKEQMGTESKNIQFEANGAFLKPVFAQHDMFICTLNTNKRSGPFREDAETFESSVNPEVDFVGSPSSGVGQKARSKMPGGAVFECDFASADNSRDASCFIEEQAGPTRDGGPLTTRRPIGDQTTGKSIFSHQVWRHMGNLMSKTVLIHPSEYSWPLSELSRVGNFTLDELQSAATWDYTEEIIEGRSVIYPNMVTKQPPYLTTFSSSGVHWSLEKWTPVWQGQDFFITVKTGEKDNDALDPNDDSPFIMTYPYDPYMNYLGSSSYTSQMGTSFGSNFVDGISNEAFYIAPKKEEDSGATTEEAKQEAKLAARKAYDWRYKTYFMVEIGVHDPMHNYFIELVKGRRPRLLHLGEE